MFYKRQRNHGYNDMLSPVEHENQRWVKAGVVSDGRQTAKRPKPANKLSDAERQRILEVCNSAAFSHLPPYQIVPRLADQGIYLGSESSFCRILKSANQLKHRGAISIRAKTNTIRHFVATQPNRVWSWDITYCPSRLIGQHYYLYMIDIAARSSAGKSMIRRMVKTPRYWWSVACGQSAV